MDIEMYLISIILPERGTAVGSQSKHSEHLGWLRDLSLGCITWLDMYPHFTFFAGKYADLTCKTPLKKENTTLNMPDVDTESTELWRMESK